MPFSHNLFLACCHEVAYKAEPCLTATHWIELALFILMVVFGFVLISSRLRRLSLRYLMQIAMAVFVSGVGLYLVGFCHEGSAYNALALVPRSVIASVEMFVSESELIEVSPEWKNDQLYMSLFAVVHFLAFCVSAAFIIHLWGFRLVSMAKVWFSQKRKRDLYVFFDLSDESIRLAESCQEQMLKRQQSGSKVNYRIVFVKTPADERTIDRFSFSHILNVERTQSEKMERLIEMDALLMNCKRNVSIGMDSADWETSRGLKRLKRYIAKSTGKKCFFCLSPNEENNIQTAVALSNQFVPMDERTTDSPNSEFQIYCRAHQDVITDSLSSYSLQIIHSAKLSLVELKRDVDSLPISYVKPDTRRAVATKPFRALIVGFGKTGYQLFSFIYENAAVMGSDGQENPIYCDIIDPNADQLKEKLYMRCPELLEHSSCHLTFWQGTVENYREHIIGWVKELDYIAVTTHDDNLNLSIGLSLVDLIYKYRETSDKVGLFIGVNAEDTFKKAQSIADYYNKCGSEDTDRKYHLFIKPFGSLERLFTYDNIINDPLVDLAKSFYYEYQKTSLYLQNADLSALAISREQEWMARRNSASFQGSKGMANKNKLSQQEFQDISNAWHIKTKRYLSGACQEICPDGSRLHTQAEERCKALYACIKVVMNQLIDAIKTHSARGEKFTLSYEYIQQKIAEYEVAHEIPAGEYQTLFGNLAKCEHLRWNAVCRLQGYRSDRGAQSNQKCYLKKTHPCLVSFDELLKKDFLKETIQYDYNTILVSFKDWPG